MQAPWATACLAPRMVPQTVDNHKLFQASPPFPSAQNPQIQEPGWQTLLAHENPLIGCLGRTREASGKMGRKGERSKGA